MERIRTRPDGRVGGQLRWRVTVLAFVTGAPLLWGGLTPAAAKGFGLRAVTLSPDGTRLYATDDAGTVDVINTATQQVVARMSLPTPDQKAPPGVLLPGVALSPDGTRLYVTHPADARYDHQSQPRGTLFVIGAAAGQMVGAVPVGRYPMDVTVSADGMRAYVVNQLGRSVSVVDTAKGEVVATIPVGRDPIRLALSADGSRLYVVNGNVSDSFLNAHRDTVSVIDTATNAVVATVTVGKWPSSVAASPDGRWVYVANWGSHTVDVIDASTNQVVRTIPIAPDPAPGTSNNTSYPSGVAVSPDGNRNYVTQGGSHTISVIDAETSGVIAGFTVGDKYSRWPTLVRVSQDGRRLYVLSQFDKALSVLDTTDGASLAVIQIKG